MNGGKVSSFSRITLAAMWRQIGCLAKTEN